MRRADAITLSGEERGALSGWAGSRTAAVQLATRARMILLAAEGWENLAIAAELGVHRVTVAIWRKRFAEQRLAGIAQERPGRGRRATRRRHWARRIVETTLHTPPKDATQWSVRSLAKYLGIDKSLVHRVWRAHELAPHRVRTFKLSRDKRFVEKLIDVVGLYLRPPEHALVLSVDEKSQIQALDRTQPGLPLKKGRCGTMTHDYKRNGTTTLFAALEMASGKLIGRCMQRHRHQEWLKFLKLIDAETPAELDLHLIADNYSTHKHPKVKAWLAKHPRIHMHFIPTSSSWLNMVERWFREITTKRIRRGSFRSVEQLEAAIQQFIDTHNDDPKPFVWTADLKDILPKIVRAHETLDKSHNQ
ncbi:MAG: IS630 family transposase [Phycisphaerae bacterium]